MALERAPRRILPADIAPAAVFDPSAEVPSEPPWAPELPWLQPYPDAPPGDVHALVTVRHEWRRSGGCDS